MNSTEESESSEEEEEDDDLPSSAAGDVAWSRRTACSSTAGREWMLATEEEVDLTSLEEDPASEFTGEGALFLSCSKNRIKSMSEGLR
jgi:hypothetical protein